jgi:hypothetical protein
MKEITTAGRLLAIAAGVAFTGGALNILLYDVVVLGHTWTMAHTLAVLTVTGVILAGELAREAWATRHYGSCLGFWLIVFVGTGLVVYNSVGRQAQANDTSTLSAEDRNDQRSATKTQLAEHQRMLDEEQASKAAEVKRGGCGKVCQGFDATIAVYQSAVAGDEAKLKALGAIEPVTPEAEKFAELASQFGADKAKVKALAVLLVPFLYTLLFEYGSIRSWGYAARRNRPKPEPPLSDTQQTSFPHRPEPKGPQLRLRFNSSEKPKSSGPKCRRDRSEVLADLLLRAATNRHFGSQEEAADHYGISPSRFSEWLTKWEAEGSISKTQIGRKKLVHA